MEVVGIKLGKYNNLERSYLAIYYLYPRIFDPGDLTS